MDQPVQYPEASLLGLPAELRNHIFTILVDRWIFKPDNTRRNFNLQYLTTAKNIIFRGFNVNKQMRRELRDLFFGNIALTLHPYVSLKSSQEIMKLPDGSISSDQAKDKAWQAKAMTSASDLRGVIGNNTRIVYFLKQPVHGCSDSLITMQMPHPAVRHKIRFLELHLKLPYMGSQHHPTKYNRVYGGEDGDWPYPLRAVKRIGFTRLETLKIAINRSDYSIDAPVSKLVKCLPASQREVAVEGPKITTWAREQIEKMDLEGIEWSLEFIRTML